jgi:hypothetical protein
LGQNVTVDVVNLDVSSRHPVGGGKGGSNRFRCLFVLCQISSAVKRLIPRHARIYLDLYLLNYTMQLLGPAHRGSSSRRRKGRGGYSPRDRRQPLLLRDERPAGRRNRAGGRQDGGGKGARQPGALTTFPQTQV